MRRLTHLALPLLVFAVGLAVGAWFSANRRATVFPVDIEHGLTKTAEAGPAPGSANGRMFASNEEMLTALMSAVAEKEPFFRSHRLHNLLERLDSAELGVLFDRTLRIDDYERQHLMLFSLLARWAEVDPTAAAAAARPYRDRVRKLGHFDGWSLDVWVDMAWSCAQPKSARSDALASPNATWARNTVSNALGTLADDSSPDQQLDLLTQFPTSRLRDEMCAKAIKTLADKDSAGAEAQLDLVSDPRLRASLQARSSANSPNAIRPRGSRDWRRSLPISALE
jgi:hypothetical protein